MQPWEVKQRRYLLERPWITLREDHVLLPNGAEMEEFHVIEYPNWAATVCLDTTGNLIMVEQYRHGIQRSSIELPAGVIEPGEPPLDAAKRELLEETGFASSNWVSLGRCSTDPSNHSNYAYLFVARDASFSQTPSLDEAEVITTLSFSPEEVQGMIEDGTVVHGIHITALTLAWLRGYLPLSTR